MMSILLIAVIFVVAFVVTVQFGWPITYVAVYLPTLILLNQLPEIAIPHLPVSVQNGPLYAILLGMPFRSEKFRFKLCSIDIVLRPAADFRDDHRLENRVFRNRNQHFPHRSADADRAVFPGPGGLCRYRNAPACA